MDSGCRQGGKVVAVGKKKTVRDRVDSDWRNYYSSSEEIKAILTEKGPEGFKREILQLAPTKGVLTYFELLWQIKENALLRSDYLNGIINVRLGRNVFPKGMLS